VLTVVLLAAAACGGAALWRASKRGKLAPPDPPTPMVRGPAQARTHDVVCYLARDWLIEGVVQIEDGRKRRRLARMVDGADVQWLLVDDGELVLLRPAGEAPPRLPAPDALTVAGETFRLSEAGGGSVARHGDVASRAAEKCRFWRYRGGGGRRAWVDEFKQPELMVGEVVPESMLELLPGS
jgi:hypothetical protein